MNDTVFMVLTFGTGPVLALVLLFLHRRAKHREDVASWERGQELRRRLRAARPTREQIEAAGRRAMQEMRERERNAGVEVRDEPSDTERLRMVLHCFGKREDNVPRTPSERDVLHAFDARGEFTDSMRLRVIDSAIRAARADGVDVPAAPEQWSDPDTGRSAPKPEPLPAGEAARRLGLSGESRAVRCVHCCDLGCAACGVSELGHQVIRTAGTDEGKPTP